MQDALEQIIWLRKRNDDLIDHLKRVDRAEHGMPELPVQPRPPKEPIGEMPRELVVYIEAHASREVKAQLERRAIQRRKRGESWDAVCEAMIPAEWRD